MNFDQILNCRAKRVCVVAAPGSGKTTGILIPKASRILADASVEASKVLLLTFSRLSALDLKRHVATMERIPRASTVHSFCLSFLLSEDNHEIRKRIDSILLDFQKDTLLSDLKLTFPQKTKPVLRKLLEEFSAGWATKPHGQIFETTKEKRKFKSAIINWLSEHQAAMMEEIVYHAVELAKQIGSTRFIDEPQFIFVDEFQDLNKLEQKFIEILAKDSRLLIVVGDPNQSIYSFKFAHPKGIQAFARKRNVKTYQSVITKRCPKRVVQIANQLLQQADPSREDLLQPASGAIPGELHFVRKETQADEFEYVLNSVAQRITTKESSEGIIILVPRRKLGTEFTKYANSQKQKAKIPNEISFAFVLKPQFNDAEQEAILLYGLLVKRDSLLHIRTYLGLGDTNHYAREITEIKQKYGSLLNAVKKAKPSDFPRKKTKIAVVCQRLKKLKGFLAAHPDGLSADAVLDELFPIDKIEIAEIRKILVSLKEDDDTAQSLYKKFIDYIRTLPHDENTVRVMTLMASKGLEADHVYVMGCNAGNIPGQNRSVHMNDYDHKAEQRRLLYVAITRARKSLTVTWSRLIPFSQAKGQYTASLRTVTSRSQRYSVVGLSEFLQDLSGISWE